MDAGRQWPRSMLYAPADRGDLLRKAVLSGADAVIADLEDAVAPAAKGAARDGIADLLDERPGTPVWVRVDPVALAADLDAVVHPHLAGVVLAKCEAESLVETTAILTRLEAARGIARPLAVIGLVESARALVGLGVLAAASPRLATFGVGEVDLLTDLRIDPAAQAAVDALRLQIVAHAVAAGLRAPIAPAPQELTDAAAIAASTAHLARIGFRSRTALHPRQLAPIHEALAPSAQAVDHAKRIVSAAERADGAVLRVGDRLVDAAVLRAARETLERAANSR